MNHPMHFDKVKPNTSVLDMRALLDAPAGKHGFLEAKDGHLYLEDGTRARFIGFNLATRSNTPTHETAEKLSERFASLGVIQGLIYSPFAGLYETILLNKGLDASLPAQTAGVQNWVSFCFWGLDIIIAAVYIIILLLYTLEKKIPEINAALLERRKQAEKAAKKK